MSDQPTQIHEQITDLGVSARFHLNDAARSLRSMANDMEATVAALREAADRAEHRGVVLDQHLKTGFHIDLGMDRITSTVTDVAFGALNTVNLVARAEQAVSSVHRAKESAGSIHGLLTVLTDQA